MFFFFQAEDGIRDLTVTGVQTCALPIYDLELQFQQALLPGKSGAELPRGAVGARLEALVPPAALAAARDRKSTRLNSSHSQISYAVFCLKKKNRCELSPPGLPLLFCRFE